MKRIAMFLTLVIFFIRCTTNFTPQNTTDKITIRTGTSFGMCVGYCQNDYVFNGTSVTLTQRDTRPQAQLATRSCQSTISQADWTRLKAAANSDLFSQQPNVIGCPDCTDAGAEYIEIQTDGQPYRVTFPASRTIPGFESLVNELRALRATFKNCSS